MGRPVDQMDNKCKAFKDCQKCVREKHGSDCIGEFRKYTWRWNNKAGVLESTNKEGSCVRELFECDKKHFLISCNYFFNVLCDALIKPKVSNAHLTYT